MIPYYGHHSSKMFIKGKPVRLGFKCWCFCSYHGYVFSTDIYCGKGTNLDNKLGLGGGDVVKQFAYLVDNKERHQFYLDNFYTAAGLLNYLATFNIKATGTMKCPFTADAVFKKKQRGYYESYTSKKVMLVKWNDTKPVIVGTNFDKIEPQDVIRKYQKSTTIFQYQMSLETIINIWGELIYLTVP